jgi:cysteine dioxygenase
MIPIKKALNPIKIESIAELIPVLNSCEIDKTENCYLNAMKRINITFVEWEKYFKFNDEKPQRVCLSKTEDYVLLLSCWEKGQEEPIHDLDSKEAWIHPICGKFIEERYKLSENKLEQVSSVLLTSQSYSYMQKSKTIYKYVNAYKGRSVCLHLYSKPVKTWREYNKKTALTSMVAYQYDIIY